MDAGACKKMGELVQEDMALVEPGRNKPYLPGQEPDSISPASGNDYAVSLIEETPTRISTSPLPPGYCRGDTHVRARLLLNIGQRFVYEG